MNVNKSISGINKAQFKSPFTNTVNLLRILWILFGMPIFHLSFHNFYSYRRKVLMLFGAKLGKGVRIRRTSKIEMPWNLEMGDFSAIGDYAVIYSQAKIKIGNNVTISQYSHLCTGSHDYNDTNFSHYSKPIIIEDHAWVAANAFIGPGVTIHKGALLGACGVTMKNLDAWKIYAGNPAKIIGERNSKNFE